MTLTPEIIVLCGGLSSEREVSLRSGQAISSVLPGSRLVDLTADALPDWLDGSKHVVLPALHGGVIGAFMEATALAQLSLIQNSPRVHKTIDVTIEYLRPGRAMMTYARADVRKVGRQIANVHVEAWQEARAKPVAALRGHFMLSGEE